MVRIMAGTLLDIAAGRMAAEELPAVLASCDRGRAGFTAPACGLWLDRVFYPVSYTHLGMVFQYPEHQLFEETTYKDIAFGPKNMGLNEQEIDERVRRAAEFVGLKPELLEKSPFELSGGEKRRAEICIRDRCDPLRGKVRYNRDCFFRLFDELGGYALRLE